VGCLFVRLHEMLEVRGWKRSAQSYTRLFGRTHFDPPRFRRRTPLKAESSNQVQNQNHQQDGAENAHAST